MKALLKLVLVLIVLVAAAFLSAPYWLGGVVKAAIEKGVPELLGVSAKLESADFALFQGRVTLKGFVLGNPEGFASDHAISFGEVTVDVEPKSLFGKVIHVRSVLVRAPEVFYEAGVGGSNLSKIMDKAGGGKGSSGQPGEKPKAEAESKSGTKVMIDDFRMEDTKVHVRAPVAAGAEATATVPLMHLTDIGKEQGGVTPAEASREILRLITQAVSAFGSGSIQLNPEAKQAVKDIKSLFKKPKPQ